MSELITRTPDIHYPNKGDEFSNAKYGVCVFVRPVGPQYELQIKNGNTTIRVYQSTFVKEWDPVTEQVSPMPEWMKDWKRAWGQDAELERSETET